MKQNKPPKARHGGMPINQNTWQVRKDQKFKAGQDTYITSPYLKKKKKEEEEKFIFDKSIQNAMYCFVHLSYKMRKTYLNRGQVSYLSAVLFY